MGAVHIKDEERVGSEATIRLEPSVYLQKLYSRGLLTSADGSDGRMGCGAPSPATSACGLKDIEIGSYGIVPSTAESIARWRPRGRSDSRGLPLAGFTITKSRMLGGQRQRLYEEAVARQWSRRAISRGRS